MSSSPQGTPIPTLSCETLYAAAWDTPEKTLTSSELDLGIVDRGLRAQMSIPDPVPKSCAPGAVAGAQGQCSEEHSLRAQGDGKQGLK